MKISKKVFKIFAMSALVAVPLITIPTIATSCSVANSAQDGNILQSEIDRIIALPDVVDATDPKISQKMWDDFQESDVLKIKQLGLNLDKFSYRVLDLNKNSATHQIDFRIEVCLKGESNFHPTRKITTSWAIAPILKGIAITGNKPSYAANETIKLIAKTTSSVAGEEIPNKEVKFEWYMNSNHEPIGTGELLTIKLNPTNRNLYDGNNIYVRAVYHESDLTSPAISFKITEEKLTEAQRREREVNRLEKDWDRNIASPRPITMSEVEKLRKLVNTAGRPSREFFQGFKRILALNPNYNYEFQSYGSNKTRLEEKDVNGDQIPETVVVDTQILIAFADGEQANTNSRFKFEFKVSDEPMTIQQEIGRFTVMGSNVRLLNQDQITRSDFESIDANNLLDRVALNLNLRDFDYKVSDLRKSIETSKIRYKINVSPKGKNKYQPTNKELSTDFIVEKVYFKDVVIDGISEEIQYIANEEVTFTPKITMSDGLPEPKDGITYKWYVGNELVANTKEFKKPLKSDWNGKEIYLRLENHNGQVWTTQKYKLKIALSFSNSPVDTVSTQSPKTKWFKNVFKSNKNKSSAQFSEVFFKKVNLKPEWFK